jgi:single-strand DNA-binding protein
MLKAQILGHLGNDCQVSNVNGVTVVNFNCCHSEKYKNKEGVIVNKSVWVNCSYFTEKTAIAAYLKKGTQIYAEGTPSVDIYKNKDNQSIPQLRLRVNMVQLLGSSNKQDNPQPQAQQPNNGTVAQDDLGEIDSLPF